MEAQFRFGKIEFDLYALLGSVGPQYKPLLIEALSCDDDIIRHVASQILTRWTENGYGGPTCSPTADPAYALDHAIREVAKRSGEVARNEIERLEGEIRRLELTRDRMITENIHLKKQLRECEGMCGS